MSWRVKNGWRRGRDSFLRLSSRPGSISLYSLDIITRVQSTVKILSDRSPERVPRLRFHPPRSCELLGPWNAIHFLLLRLFCPFPLPLYIRLIPSPLHPCNPPTLSFLPHPLFFLFNFFFFEPDARCYLYDSTTQQKEDRGLQLVIKTPH